MNFDTKLAYVLDAVEKVPADHHTVGASSQDTHGL